MKHKSIETILEKSVYYNTTLVKKISSHTSAAIPKSIIQVAVDARRVPTCLAIRESKNLIRRGSLFSVQSVQDRCIVCTLACKQHEFVEQQMRQTYYRRICTLHFFFRSIKENHIIALLI